MKTLIRFISRLLVTAVVILVNAFTVINAACLKVADGTQWQNLLAGQDIAIGQVSTTITDDSLVITYTVSNGWQIAETHLWVGSEIGQMPQTRKGTPKIGLFPYSNGASGQQQSYTIPLSSLNYSCPAADQQMLIAAHASVVLDDGAGNIIQQETAWADGSRFVEKGMWGTFYNTTLTCDCQVTPPNEGKCETAFAYAGGTNAIDGDITNSFLEIDEDGDSAGDFNRWGWSNGAIGAGLYQWDLYAGAGQSDISKGTLVGSLTVSYDGNSAMIDYNVSAPYFMEENHLYVGSEILPRDKRGDFTVAPGQYSFIHESLDGARHDNYLVNVNGSIYVVAHATVCGL